MTPKDNPKATCWYCAFSNRLETRLECWRFPPTVRIDAGGYQKEDRPRVLERGWCGEFKRQEPSK